MRVIGWDVLVTFSHIRHCDREWFIESTLIFLFFHQFGIRIWNSTPVDQYQNLSDPINGSIHMDDLLRSVETKDEANSNVIELTVSITDGNGWMNGSDVTKI